MSDPSAVLTVATTPLPHFLNAVTGDAVLYTSTNDQNILFGKDSANSLLAIKPKLGIVQVDGILSCSNVTAQVITMSSLDGNSASLTTNGGNLGVNMNGELPNYSLTVNGNIYTNQDVLAASDLRFKNNLQHIEGALDKVESINGYTFSRINDNSSKRYAGLVAQEVETILPEVVHTDEAGYKSVAYGNVVALLVEAIKEMNVKIRDLDSKIPNFRN